MKEYKPYSDKRWHAPFSVAESVPYMGVDDRTEQQKADEKSRFKARIAERRRKYDEVQSQKVPSQVASS